LLAVVRVHEEETADALALALGRVEHRGAAVDRAGVATKEGELTDVGVVDDLERERGERSLVRGLARHALFGIVRVNALDGGDVLGAGHEVDDRVEELLDALVLEGRAAEDGDDLVAEGALTERGEDLLLAEGGVALEESLHERVVDLGHGFEELLAMLL